MSLGDPEDSTQVYQPPSVWDNVLRMSFHDFWSTWDVDNNRFIKLIKSQCPDTEIIIDDDTPDIVFYSVFNRTQKSHDFLEKYPKSLVIFYTGENRRPDFKRCDLALSFDWLDDPRNYRLPLYQSRLELMRSSKWRSASLDEHILDRKKKFCCFLVSNEKGQIRNEVYEQLNNYKKVDSGGRFMNNIGGQSIGRGDKTFEWIHEYKFFLCFENSEYPGYTTEKLPNAYISGTVGIYWGNPVVDRDFNTKAFVNYYDHGSIQALVDRVIELDNDDEQYLAMLREPIFHNDEVPEPLQSHNIFEFIKNGYEEKQLARQARKAQKRAQKEQKRMERERKRERKRMKREKERMKKKKLRQHK